MPPLPNHRLIHPRFESHHRPVTADGMTAECAITRPASAGTPVFDEATARSQHPAAASVYTGACRITRAPLSAANVVVADRPVDNARYVVAIPADAPLVQAGDLVTLTACDGDPAIVGQPMPVTDVTHGSITWQRDLLCEFSQPTTR
ncbi:DUF6093 family protein [Micromonospora chersina]|uniref:DUF6093 family protein n=1 Tax=Micromonospora chersina TaxID=47854 RepID=UPI003710A610